MHRLKTSVLARRQGSGARWGSALAFVGVVGCGGDPLPPVVDASAHAYPVVTQRENLCSFAGRVGAPGRVFA